MTDLGWADQRERDGLTAYLCWLAFDGRSGRDGDEPTKRGTGASFATALSLPRRVCTGGPEVHNGRATLENPREACFPARAAKVAPGSAYRGRATGAGLPHTQASGWLP